MAKLTFKYRPPKGLLPPGLGGDSEPPTTEAGALEASADPKVDRWWYESSHDLRQGLDVSDVPLDSIDTIPDQLSDDELFARPRSRRHR